MPMKYKLTVLRIQGLVQGVGFRPFVYRVATEMGVRGEVDNRNDGVYIRAHFAPGQQERFLERIKTEHPPVASVYRIVELEPEHADSLFTGFTIVPSRSGSDEITQVSPDIAVCDACLADRKTQPHRLGYPFINCTHCGPRFTILRDLPYDRARTTMAGFPLCPDCAREYDAVSDRRFHAQPVACNRCGPVYYADWQGKRCAGYDALLALSCRLIAAGEVIAVKGIGGYHLVCNAADEAAVERLRQVKMRDTKPFAVMFRDAPTVREYAALNAVEESELASWRRPIVLLEQQGRSLAPSLNPGMHTLGAMLPYMPLHYDWFDRLPFPALVMTSGNRSELPVAITASEVEAWFAAQVPLVLHHDREIYNRADDSVLQVCGGRPRLIRRARGYVPEPLFADGNVDGILAFGAEKSGAFALGKADTVLQSQYIGDLKNWETYCFYKESLQRFRRLFRFTPQVLACDLHPDYFSSREAEKLAQEERVPLVRIQHHHAHAAACMLEYGLHEPVVALVMDGTGLGDDGAVWGGEFLWCDRQRYRRLAHFGYVPLPGGDKAATEPWRMAVAYASEYNVALPSGFEERIGHERIQRLKRLITKKVNAPLTSSAGRLFDAVASLTGICDVASRQAEAAVLLEQAAAREEADPYPAAPDAGESLSFGALIAGVCRDMNAGVPLALISARFHGTLAGMLKEKTCALVRETGAGSVVLSGGCFQNKRLAASLQRLLEEEGVRVYLPSAIPCNDSGIAVGQLAVAAERLRREKDKPE